MKQEIVKNNVEESDDEEENEEGSDSEEELNQNTDEVEEREIEAEEQSESEDERLEQDSCSDKSDREPDVESDEEYDDGSDEDSNDADSNQDSDDELNSDENSFVSSLKEALGKTEKQSSIRKVSKTSKIQKVEGESVVKMLDLKSRDAKNELMQTQEKADNSQHKAGAQKRSSFFLGGESDDNEDLEQSDNESDEDGPRENIHQRNGGGKNKNVHPGFDKSKVKRDSDSHNRKRDQNFGGKRKQFQKVTSVKKPKFNKGPDRPFSAPAEDRSLNKNVLKNNMEVKVKQNDKNKIVDVHPSWEAKQKQKPSIQTFQGKKTVFE